MLFVSDITLASPAANPEGGAPRSRRAATVTCAIAFLVSLGAFLPDIDDPVERAFVAIAFSLGSFLGSVVQVTLDSGMEVRRTGTNDILERGPGARRRALAAAVIPVDSSEDIYKAVLSYIFSQLYVRYAQ